MSFFFFKQKTAYEMRISDWSSDVCSSDLLVAAVLDVHGGLAVRNVAAVDVGLTGHGGLSFRRESMRSCDPRKTRASPQRASRPSSPPASARRSPRGRSGASPCRRAG